LQSLLSVARVEETYLLLEGYNDVHNIQKEVALRQFPLWNKYTIVDL